MRRRAMTMLTSLPVFATCLFAFGLNTLAHKDKDAKVKLTKAEQQILDMTNEARKKEKLPPLEPSPLLFRAARAHSENMAKRQKFEHVLDGETPFQRIKATGYRYYYAGENIGMGEEGYPIDKLFKDWMDSKSHRANILHAKYREIGLAAVKDKKGVTWYTQVFALPKPGK